MIDHLDFFGYTFTVWLYAVTNHVLLRSNLTVEHRKTN